MIEITRQNGEIKIAGHANYAPAGQDIVCASISILVQNLIQSIDTMTMDKIQYDMKPGMVHIKHGNLSEHAQVLVDSFFIGCEMIAHEYPQNVQLIDQALKS